MIYGLSRIDSGRVVVFDNAILGFDAVVMSPELELVEFFDNAIFSSACILARCLLELVEFFDNAIF